MYKSTKKAPKGAQYHKTDSNDYFKIEKGMVKEWHGNHWEVSFFTQDSIEAWIDCGSAKAFYLNIMAHFLVAIIKIIVSVLAVVAITS